MRSYLFVANWKMELTYNEACKFFNQDLTQLTNLQPHHLILCPSFDALSCAVKKTQQLAPNITIGSQNCSGHERGPYTGQVAATSLAQLGISHSIIGHSERREYQSESNKEIFAKAEQLVKNNITPIICIGETAAEQGAGKMQAILAKQIDMCTSIYNNLYSCDKIYLPPEQLCIAYEPIWAIGSGITPDKEQLIKIFSWLRSKLGPKPLLLYGGSVNEKNIKEIAAATKEIDGFLIGKASCNIKSLKSMINLLE